MTLPYSTRLTMPLTISPTRSLYSSYCRSRSASRTFCTMTCLAFCAATRPKSSGGSGSAMRSPISASGLRRLASSRLICVASFSIVSTTAITRASRVSPVRASISQRMSISAPYRDLAAFWIASSIAWMTMRRSIDFSRATASAICKSSSRLALMPAKAMLLLLQVLGSHGAVRDARFSPLLRAGQRLADELVRQHKPRLADELERQAEVRAAGPLELGRDPDLARLVALERAAEPLAALDRLAQLDLGLVAAPVLEIRRPDERAIDAGRGDLEPVAAGHRIVRIEQRRHLTRNRLAIVDADAAVRPLGHDLHRLSVPPRHLDPHETEAQVLEHRLDE